MKHNTPRWIRHTYIFRKDEYECNSCGYHSNKPYIFCPSCSSQMKGSKYDPSWVDEMEILDAIFDD